MARPVRQVGLIAFRPRLQDIDQLSTRTFNRRQAQEWCKSESLLLKLSLQRLAI